jgi:hypothetical protein
LIKRYSKLYKKVLSFEDLQSKIKREIVSKNVHSDYLRKYTVIDANDFEKLPIISYSEIQNDVLSFLETKNNHLSCQKIIAFAQSSGTTSAKKWIPHSFKNILYNYLAGFDMLTLYLKSFPDSKIIKGKNFSLTGSLFKKNDIVIGDVSALIAYYLPWIFSFFKVPNKKNALIENWHEKLEILKKELANSDIRWLAGVPSWLSIVVDEIQKKTNKNICLMWPNFEVLFYGGTSIDWHQDFFKKQFKQIHFWQVYNASEGFFAIQWSQNSNAMALMPHYGIYYEFLDIKTNKLILFKDLKISNQYELVISNVCGLWRYRMGDIIEVTNLNPLLVIIVGRTQNCINAFGEEVIEKQVECALKELRLKMNFEIDAYTVAPEVFENGKGKHQWLIAWRQEPENLEIFEKELDTLIQKINADYAAKRIDNLVLENLKVTSTAKSNFLKWLENKNRLTVQAKIPKMSNNLEIIHEILSFEILQ